MAQKMKELDEKMFDMNLNKPLSDMMADEGLNQLKDREVWDANEMTPAELDQLMKTWTQVAEQTNYELKQDIMK